MAIDNLMAPGRPFVLGVQGQPITSCQLGLCDNVLMKFVQGLEDLRYSTGLFVGTVDGVSGDITFAVQEVDVFVSGVGTPPPVPEGMWWKVTLADTDLQNKADGDLIPEGFCFYGMGVVINAYRFFQKGGTTATAAKYYPRVSATEIGYQDAFIAAVLVWATWEIQFTQTGCTYIGGPFEIWTDWGGPHGEGVTRNGITAAPGLYLPTNIPFCIGSNNDLDEMQIVTKIQHAMTFQSIAGAPIVAPTGTVDATVYQPFRIKIIGYPICCPDTLLCGVPVGGVPVPFQPNPPGMAPPPPQQIPPGGYGYGR